MSLLNRVIENGGKVAVYGRLIYNLDFIKKFSNADIEKIIEESGVDSLRNFLTDIDAEVMIGNHVPPKLVKEFALTPSTAKKQMLQEFCIELCPEASRRLLETRDVDFEVDYTSGDINALPIHNNTTTIDSVLLYATIIPERDFLISSYKYNKEFNPEGKDGYLEKAFNRFIDTKEPWGNAHKRVLRLSYIGKKLSQTLSDSKLYKHCDSLRERIYENKNTYTGFFLQPEVEALAELETLKTEIRNAFLRKKDEKQINL